MNLIDRVKAILTTPDTEWPIIAREPGDPAFLFSNYVLYLAAIPAVASFIGSVIIGVGTPVGTYRTGLISGLLGAILQYVLAFVAAYLVAMIVDALAPTFQGRKDFQNALKLTVYSYTPVWLAGIFLLFPGLRFLTILGLYGFYLFWKGLPILMQSPADKTLGYAVAIVVCAVVISLVFSFILGLFLFA
jgi:hypothetical protein